MNTASGRAARFISARPRLAWASTAVLLTVLALGLTSLKTGPISNAGQFVGKPDSVPARRPSPGISRPARAVPPW